MAEEEVSIRDIVGRFIMHPSLPPSNARPIPFMNPCAPCAFLLHAFSGLLRRRRLVSYSSCSVILEAW
jgi:hypothetical protein